MMQRTTFDAPYLALLTARDPETEAHFLAYFGELLMIKLRATLRCPQAIADVRQETFLRVFRVLRTNGVASPEKLGAFVNGVCNNVLSEHYRSSTRVSQIPERRPESASEGPDPEQELQTRERRNSVRQVLNTLPLKDQEILRMLFFMELEKDEVCRRYRVDRSYLRVLLHRAKNRFRQQAAGRIPTRSVEVLLQSA